MENIMFNYTLIKNNEFTILFNNGLMVKIIYNDHIGSEVFDKNGNIICRGTINSSDQYDLCILDKFHKMDNKYVNMTRYFCKRLYNYDNISESVFKVEPEQLGKIFQKVSSWNYDKWKEEIDKRMI